VSIRIWSRWLALGALIVLPAPVCASGPPLFGSLSIDAFGNDVTTGASYPFNTSVFQPFPIGHRCLSESPYTGNGAPAPDYCGESTLRRGRPIRFVSGMWVSTAPQPAPVSFPYLNFLNRTPNGHYNWATYFWTTGARYTPRAGAYLHTSFLVYAPHGSLRAGAGPGSKTFVPPNPLRGSIAIRAGRNQFGGALGILQGLYARQRFTVPGQSGVWSGTSFWYFMNGGWSGSQLQRTATFYNPTLGKTLTRTRTATPFHWTTGQVTVYAREGEFTTTLMRSGFDHRSPRGQGSIQLVAPQLTHWGGPGPDDPTGSIAVLWFVPEPGAVLLLAAGLSALALLHRVSRRR